jgi:hypothetical protein
MHDTRSGRLGTVPEVYRAPLWSRRDDVDRDAAVAHALARGICGVGGAVTGQVADPDEAVARVATEHGERVAERLTRFIAAADGSYVWTRDGDGALHLGRLTGPWRHDTSAEAAAHDRAPVRPCEWLGPVDPALVPASVTATFARGGRNFQQIHPGDVERLTDECWRLLQED